MFEWLKEFSKILVTGPHRTGTRICSRMIAYDTGYRFVDELEIKVDSLYSLQGLYQNHHHFVVQCPSLCRYIHLFNADDTAIVLMRRSLADIATSQGRIHWPWEKIEMGRYDKSNGNIAEIKYSFWEQAQRDQIFHAFEVDYDSLAAHPFWVRPQHRENFRAGQTISTQGTAPLNPLAKPYQQPGSVLLTGQWSSEDLSGILVKTESSPQTLNITAYLIWSLCDGSRTIEDIVHTLATQFENTQESLLIQDTHNIINLLISQNFLQLVI